jgi:methanogenic corrinoid protein MtbC1
LRELPGKVRLVPPPASGAMHAVDDVGYGELLTPFVDGLRSGDTLSVHRLIRGLRDRGEPFAAIADRLIQPSMALLGHEWRTNQIDVYQEHRASRIVEVVLMEMVAQDQEAQAASPSGPRPLALGASPEDDLYTLAGLACELALREVGWNVINLGSNLPTSSLTEAVLRHRPRLAWISVSHLENPPRFVREFRPFAETAERVGTAVILGGQALDAEYRTHLPGACFGTQVGDIVELARRLEPARSTRPSPAPGTTTDFSVTSN